MHTHAHPCTHTLTRTHACAQPRACARTHPHTQMYARASRRPAPPPPRPWAVHSPHRCIHGHMPWRALAGQCTQQARAADGKAVSLGCARVTRVCPPKTGPWRGISRGSQGPRRCQRRTRHNPGPRVVAGVGGFGNCGGGEPVMPRKWRNGRKTTAGHEQGMRPGLSWSLMDGLPTCCAVRT